MPPTTMLDTARGLRGHPAEDGTFDRPTPGLTWSPGPRTTSPSTRGSGTDGPRTDGPRTHGPCTDGPRTHGPCTGDPRTGDPGTHGPCTGDPRTGDPGTHGPRTDDLLTKLRSPGASRPAVDPCLAAGLRAWLEDVASDADPGVVTAADVAGRPWGDGRPAGGAAARETVRSALARISFRLAVTGSSSVRPVEDALRALAIDDRAGTARRALEGLSARALADLRAVALSDALAISAQWRRVPPSWLPRTAERLRAPLAGGGVVLATSADLALGSPATGTASVCLVHVRTAPPAEPDGRARGLLALVETLRSGAPPLRVATYHPGERLLVTEDVTESLLVASVRNVRLALLGGWATGVTRP